MGVGGRETNDLNTISLFLQDILDFEKKYFTHKFLTIRAHEFIEVWNYV